MTHPTHLAFRRWRRRVGATWRECSVQLGVCVTTVQTYETGVAYGGLAGKRAAHPVPRGILLACAALEAGIPPVGAKGEPETKACPRESGERERKC